MMFKVYETAFDHLKGNWLKEGHLLKDSFKEIGQVTADDIQAALKLAQTTFPNRLAYRLTGGDMALDYSETLCVMCGIGKIGMWVGVDKESRRVVRVCPKCEGQDRVGKVSS
jgi:hypothetical protein